MPPTRPAQPTLRFAGRCAAGTLLAVAGLALVVVLVGPISGAYRLATVLSGSMGPGMPVGSLAVLVPVDPADVHVGDVITYQTPTDHRVVTHRVVEITTPGRHPVLRTKGDANASADPWEARLVGPTAWKRAAVVPHAGKSIRFLRSAPVHHATVHVIPIVLLAAMLRSIWSPGRRRVSRREACALGTAVVLAAVAPPALAGFTGTAAAANTIGTAADWVAPSVSTHGHRQADRLSGRRHKAGRHIPRLRRCGRQRQPGQRPGGTRWREQRREPHHLRPDERDPHGRVLLGQRRQLLAPVGPPDGG